MKTNFAIYHGGEKIETEVKSPLFLYETISDSIYFATGYSGVENTYVSEFKLNANAKVLDLVEGNTETNEKFINEIMKKAGMQFEGEYQLVKNSYKEVGREVYGYDIDLALFPKFREEMLKTGFNVLKTYSVMENTQPKGYAVLDSSVIEMKKEYELTFDDNNVYLKVSKDNLSDKEESTLGKSYIGQTGYGNITLEEVKDTKKNKKKM